MMIEPDPETSLRLIICKDFNGGPECAAVCYLEDGFVDSNFLEDGENVMSSKKQMPLSSPLTDAMCAVDQEPPPMLVGPKLISLMEKEGMVDNPALSNDLVERFTWIFGWCANHMNKKTSEKCMDISDVEKWLIAINGIVSRESSEKQHVRWDGKTLMQMIRKRNLEFHFWRKEC
jgi:hypothetical protein